MMSFIANFCFEVIEKVASSVDPNNLLILNEIIQKFNLRFNSNEEFVDVCLLVLSIVSYEVSKRNDLLVILD